MFTLEDLEVMSKESHRTVEGEAFVIAQAYAPERLRLVEKWWAAAETRLDAVERIVERWWDY
jgi:hypothetical protein